MRLFFFFFNSRYFSVPVKTSGHLFLFSPFFFLWQLASHCLFSPSFFFFLFCFPSFFFFLVPVTNHTFFFLCLLLLIRVVLLLLLLSQKRPQRCGTIQKFFFFFHWKLSAVYSVFFWLASHAILLLLLYICIYVDIYIYIYLLYHNVVFLLVTCAYWRSK